MSNEVKMVSVPRHIGKAPINGRHYVAECISCGWVGSSCELTEDAVCARMEGDSMCLSDVDEIGSDRLLAIVQAMAHAAEQHQGEPVAWIVTDINGDSYFAYDKQTPSDQPLYTHADPAEAINDLEDAKEACAEIERTGMPGEVIREMNDEIVDLRDALED